MDHHYQAGHHDGDHAHKLDEDVQGRSGCVFERISDGVTDHGSMVVDGVLASEVTVFDILLGIVPGTA